MNRRCMRLDTDGKKQSFGVVHEARAASGSRQPGKGGGSSTNMTFSNLQETPWVTGVCFNYLMILKYHLYEARWDKERDKKILRRFARKINNF